MSGHNATCKVSARYILVASTDKSRFKKEKNMAFLDNLRENP